MIDSSLEKGLRVLSLQNSANLCYKGEISAEYPIALIEFVAVLKSKKDDINFRLMEMVRMQNAFKNTAENILEVVTTVAEISVVSEVETIINQTLQKEIKLEDTESKSVSSTTINQSFLPPSKQKNTKRKFNDPIRPISSRTANVVSDYSKKSKFLQSVNLIENTPRNR